MGRAAGCVGYARGVNDGSHIPVLIEPVVRLLDPRPGEVFVDATAGLGGHASAIGPRLTPGGVVVLNDVDPANLEHAAARVRRESGPGVDVRVVRANFAELPHTLRRLGLRADMLLADLGFASTQMDDAARGFSFMREGPLDMRLDPSAPVTAAELVATLPERELARIIREYGEERHAGRVAAVLVRARAQRPIDSTNRLAEVVRGAVPRSPGGIDPATRTFQALRIAVNDELGVLEALLSSIERAASGKSSGGDWLAPGARIGMISFHSLEDRCVKRAFRACEAAGAADVTGGVIVAEPEEEANNPRSRSAKLRVVRLAGK